jgi:outer membrane lipoprotein carrier protein
VKTLTPVVLLSLLLWLSPAAATDPDVIRENVLDGIEKRYSGQSFSAEFTQTATLVALDMIETASGKAWFRHPGKMKWSYLTPQNHDIITNGETLWIFRPQDNQVMEGSASEFFSAGAGGAFLSDIRLIRKHYAISVQDTGPDWIDLLLDSQNGDEDIVSIVIRVQQHTHEIIRVTSTNTVGDYTTIDFVNIRFEMIPEHIFEFTLPEGVQVLEMN